VLLKLFHQENEPGATGQAIGTLDIEAVKLPLRYRVKRFLGEGGRKWVYLVRDSKLDRDVAIASIKAEGLDQAGLARVRREAQAMGRLGSHPFIVTVFDLV